MTRSKNLAVIVLAGVVGLAVAKLWGQGFGSFSHDQPFMAENPIQNSDFVPTDIAGMQWWLAADYGVTNVGQTWPATNGGKIIAWADKSPNNLWFTNYYDDQGPIWYSNQTTNGLPAVKADFTPVRLVGRTNQIWAQPNTYFLVYQSIAANQVLLVSTNESSGSLQNAVYMSSTGPALKIYSGSTLTGGNLPDGLWVIATVIFNGANSSIRTNGSLCISGNAGTGSQHGVTFGSSSSGAGGYTYPIAEGMMYNSLLNSNEVWRVENYLAKKYNLTNSVLTGL